MLGHKSATLTLDLYGHLFPDRLDVVADAMNAARLKALSDRHQIGTKQAPAEVVELHTGQTWTVGFCGFAPGFAYLQGENDRLRFT